MISYKGDQFVAIWQNDKRALGLLSLRIHRNGYLGASGQKSEPPFAPSTVRQSVYLDFKGVGQSRWQRCCCCCCKFPSRVALHRTTSSAHALAILPVCCSGCKRVDDGTFHSFLGTHSGLFAVGAVCVSTCHLLKI